MNIEKARVELAELDEKRKAVESELRAMRETAETESRDLTEDESKRADDKFAELDTLDNAYGSLRGKIEEEEKRDARLKPALEHAVANPSREATSPAVARGSLKQEMIYRPNNENGARFFRDVVNSQRGDWAAAERLNRHQAHQLDQMTSEQLMGINVEGERAANTTASTAGGGFIPPVFLGEYYAEYAREGRPFVNTIPNLPLMATGMTLTIPRITTGTLTADQGATENAALTSQAIVDSPLSVPVRTIGGYNDLSQQLWDRSDPGIDQIIFNDLRADYDLRCDTKALAGTGTNEHTGIRAVSSINTVQYTDASPTAAELTPKFYDGIQKIASNRYRPATHVVMHPRRAAWLASNLSSTFPLFQQGGYVQAAGSQDQGFVQLLAGLPVVQDANIATNYSDGGNTNEDEIYVVHAPDLLWFEGPVQVRVDPYTVGLNLTVRVVLYAYSAFASGRFAKSITKIYGSGLATPSF